MKEIIEEWRDIAGYEGYQVSNTGKVRSLNYLRTGQAREIKPDVNKGGYRRVGLYKNKSIKHVSVHRLVAQAFLPNPMNLPEINHKDEDKSNNCASNLEWCDRLYNNNFGTHNKRVAESNQKKVLCEETNIVYPSLKEAARQTGLFKSSISLCCNGIYKSAGGYHWKYIKEPYQQNKFVLF